MKCGAAGFLSLSDRSPILALTDYRDRIVIDPEIGSGNRARITVGEVLSYLAWDERAADSGRFSATDARRHPRLPGVCRGARTADSEHPG